MNILEIKKMNFCYKQQYVLRNFTLSLKEGCIYGLVGKPKSGKTTVLKLILGLLQGSSSTIYIKGRNFRGSRAHIQEAIGSIVDLPYYQNFLTVRENLKYVDMLYCYGDVRIMEILHFIGLSENANTKVRRLSITQRRCLSIGMALYHNPDLLVFDDLLRDVDEEGRKVISNLLLRVKGLGKTVLLSSRNYMELSPVCTHVGLLKSGSIVEERVSNMSWEPNFSGVSVQNEATSRANMRMSYFS